MWVNRSYFFLACDLGSCHEFHSLGYFHLPQYPSHKCILTRQSYPCLQGNRKCKQQWLLSLMFFNREKRLDFIYFSGKLLISSIYRNLLRLKRHIWSLLSDAFIVLGWRQNIKQSCNQIKMLPGIWYIWNLRAVNLELSFVKSWSSIISHVGWMHSSHPQK